MFLDILGLLIFIIWSILFVLGIFKPGFVIKVFNFFLRTKENKQ